MKKKHEKPSVLKILVKAFFVIFLGFIWIYTALGIIGFTVEEGGDYYNSDAYLINYCDKYYYEKQYEELFAFMHLYDAYDEQFDVYWEVTDAYADLQEYRKWTAVSEAEIENAKDMERKYYDRVLSAASNCRFPQNQKYLDDFVEALEQ